MKETQYYDLPELSHLYLEDSFVLDIKEENNYVEFLIEAVLTEENPLYITSSPQEQYCYQKAKICFSNAKKIIWIEKTNVFYTDIDGEIDRGNIVFILLLKMMGFLNKPLVFDTL